MTATFESVTAAQRGDRESFARLYETHRRLVHSVIYARVGNPTIAEDLTSETFTRAWASRRTFDGRNFGGWVRTIANNLARDLVKSSRWRLDTAADMTSDGPYDIAGAVDVADSVELAGMATVIRQAVDRLPVYQRMVITDRYLNGFSVDETADRADVSTGAVRSHQHRETVRLATELAGIETRAARDASTRHRQRHAHQPSLSAAA